MYKNDLIELWMHVGVWRAQDLGRGRSYSSHTKSNRPFHGFVRGGEGGGGCKHCTFLAKLPE